MTSPRCAALRRLNRTETRQAAAPKPSRALCATELKAASADAVTRAVVARCCAALYGTATTATSMGARSGRTCNLGGADAGVAEPAGGVASSAGALLPGGSEFARASGGPVRASEGAPAVPGMWSMFNEPFRCAIDSVEPEPACAPGGSDPDPGGGGGGGGRLLVGGAKAVSASFHVVALDTRL